MSDDLSLRIGLLDKQIVDSERLPIGRVDDLALELGAAGEPPRVVAVQTGAEALGERLGGALGRLLRGPAARLRSPDRPGGPARIDASIVDAIEPFVRLGVPFSELHDVAPLERWLAKHVVERLPGGGDAGY